MFEAAQVETHQCHQLRPALAPVETPRGQIKMRRPSFLDCRFHADTCVVDCGDGEFELCLGGCPLASIRIVPLDLTSLNHRVEEARNRRPRWRV